MSALADAVAFFAPELEVWCFPAWDCLPYDRASPNAEIGARRADMLSLLAAMAEEEAAPPRLLITTVSAALQRVPARAAFADTIFAGRIGGTVSLDSLNEFLVRNGYSRTGTVMEPGEYAQRGGLIDIFPPGAETPMRLDFFGDELESLRLFDPLTQRTTGNAEGFRLGPVSEVTLDQASIDRFRAGYRQAFGAVTGRIRSITASAPGAAMSAWNTGCRCSTMRWKVCSTICPARGSRWIPRARRRSRLGLPRSPSISRRGASIWASGVTRLRPIIRCPRGSLSDGRRVGPGRGGAGRPGTDPVPSPAGGRRHLARGAAGA